MPTPTDLDVSSTLPTRFFVMDELPAAYAVTRVGRCTSGKVCSQSAPSRGGTTTRARSKRPCT